MIEFINNSNRNNLIIFVHGFIGGKDTWIREDGKDSILDYLKRDKDFAKNYDFAVFDYFTKITDSLSKGKSAVGYLIGQKWKLNKNIPIDDIADTLQTEIRFNCQRYENIVIIAHSMGGLVTKSYLIKEVEESRSCPVILFISLAVPHKGSGLATFGKFIFKNPQIKGLDPLSEIISNLNKKWLKYSDKLPDTLYFQCKNDQIVPKTSAISDYAKDNEILYTDDDHFSIVHPEKKEDVVVKAIKITCLDQIKKIQNNNKATVIEEKSIQDLEYKNTLRQLPTFEVGNCTKDPPGMICDGEIVRGIGAAKRVVEEIDESGEKQFDVIVTGMERLKSYINRMTNPKDEEIEKKHELNQALKDWEKHRTLFITGIKFILWDPLFRKLSNIYNSKDAAETICGWSKLIFENVLRGDFYWYLWFIDDKQKLYFPLAITKSIENTQQKKYLEEDYSKSNRFQGIKRYQAYTIDHFDRDVLHSRVVPEILKFISNEKIAGTQQKEIEFYLDVTKWRWSIDSPFKFVWEGY